jgi:hypothetical protein
MDYLSHTSTVCPVDPDALVAVDLGDGQPVVGRADAFAWHAFADDDGAGRILGYALLGPVGDAAQALHARSLVFHG